MGNKERSKGRYSESSQWIDSIGEGRERERGRD